MMKKIIIVKISVISKIIFLKSLIILSGKSDLEFFFSQGKNLKEDISKLRNSTTENTINQEQVITFFYNITFL